MVNITISFYIIYIYPNGKAVGGKLDEKKKEHMQRN